MKNKLFFTIVLIFGLVFNQSFAQFEMKKQSINSGGKLMSGGQFQMTSSIAQVDASGALNSTSYRLSGGFWHKSNGSNANLIFKNDFE